MQQHQLFKALHSLTKGALYVIFVSSFMLGGHLHALSQNPPDASQDKQFLTPQKDGGSFIFENFNAVFNDELPAGWSSGMPLSFRVRGSDGVNNSKRLARRFFNGQTSGFWQTPAVELGNDPVFRFQYRVVNTEGYPNTATPPTRFLLKFSISTDGGATFTVFHQRGRTSPHVTQTNYAPIEVGLSAWAGTQAIIRLDVEYFGGAEVDYWVDFDDISIGSFYEAHFSVNNGTDPIANAVVSVPGQPFPTSLTDALGQAALELPNGEFSFRIAATHYLTYNAPVTISGSDISVPAVTLIGNFPATFVVRDQNMNPLTGAVIQYSGTAQSYNGPQEVSGTLTTNGSGQATVALPNGTYSYTATFTDHEPQTGSFSMNNAAFTENIQLQIYPMVTFTILGEMEVGGEEPLQNASVVIDGFPALLTNASGQAQRRLPPADHTYTATKIGYEQGVASFNLPTFDDLALPPLVLSKAATHFEFVTPADGQLTFRKTLAGQSSPQKLVTFANVGSGELVISPEDITLAGADALDFTLVNLAETVTLLTGQQASVTLRFTPQSPGSKTAQLQIEDNLGKTLQVVELSGLAYEAEVLPFADDFQSGDFSNWVVENGTQTNQWHVGQPAGAPGVMAAIVSNDGGVNNAYSINTQGVGNFTSFAYFYQDVVLPPFQEGQVKLQFQWKGVGQTNADRMRVFIMPTSVNLVAGSNIPVGQGAVLLGNFDSQAQWQSASIDIPPGQHNAQRRIVFQWVNNNDAIGAQPPAAVDQIYIGRLYNLQLASQPSAGGVLSGAGSYQAAAAATLQATPEAGYFFQSWSAPAGSFDDSQLPQTMFTVPAQDVTATAHFGLLPPIVEDLTVTYTGVAQGLSATVSPGFDLVWFDAEANGNEVEPEAVQAGEYTFWAIARDTEGFESQRVPAVLTIEPAPIGITAEDQSKEYGEEDPELTYIVSEGALLGDDALAGTLVRETGEDVGDYAILQGTLHNPNYDITFVAGSLSIEPAHLTVTANDKIKFFDGDPFPIEDYSVSYSGFKLGETEQVLEGALVFGGPAIEATEPGEYPIFVSGLTSDNYQITYLQGTLTISELMLLTLEGLVAEDKTYDGTAVAVLNFDNAQLVGVEEDDVVFLDFANVSAHFASVNAGDNIPVVYTGLEIAGEDSFKYLLLLPDVSASILPRNLEVTADTGQSKILGQPDPEVFTYSLTAGSFVGDDQFTGALSREAGEEVGIYPLLQGTLWAGSNYSISFISDVFTIYALLTLEAVPAQGGSVAGGGTYLTGDQVTVEAVAAQGYVFVTWKDDQDNDISSEAAFTYTMAGVNATLFAHFAPVTYTLTLIAQPEDGGVLQGAGQYTEGEQVEVVAIANEGFVFAGWFLDDALLSPDEAYSFAMPAQDYTLRAEFDAEPPPAYTLSITVEPENGGTVSGEGSYAEGETVEVAATANAGFLFKGWYEGEELMSNQAVYSFDMPARDLTLRAVFDPENHVPATELSLLRVYPNPASDYLNVVAEGVITRLELLDVSGRGILTMDGGGSQIQIPTGHLEPGVYFLRVTTAKGLQVRKIQVIR